MTNSWTKNMSQERKKHKNVYLSQECESLCDWWLIDEEAQSSKQFKWPIYEARTRVEKEKNFVYKTGWCVIISTSL